MKRLTPAAVTLMTVVVVSLLVTAYFAKVLLAEEPKARLFEAAQGAVSRCIAAPFDRRAQNAAS